MFGILLAAASSAFGELANSLGKKKVGDGAESYYTFGFLNLFFGVVLLTTIGFLSGNMIFSASSLPTFVTRAFFEILQVQLTLMAVVKADRSDFGLVKTLTIPFLLLVDIALGYSITTMQFFGITLILIAIALLLSVERLKTKGLWLLIGSSLNAVITISLYKYDITHFNSVEAEQSVMSLILMTFLFMSAMTFYKENPLRFLRKPIFLAQTVSGGLSNVVSSFAYAFAPATIIVTALRSSSVFFSILSGRLYFKEGNIFAKVFLMALIVAGLVLLI